MIAKDERNTDGSSHRRLWSRVRHVTSVSRRLWYRGAADTRLHAKAMAMLAASLHWPPVSLGSRSRLFQWVALVNGERRRGILGKVQRLTLFGMNVAVALPQHEPGTWASH